ncbi:cofactor D [Kwoniella mangroviensis CBS 10435]|uniref:Cofactor D n=1 Tax=Kwoniella mangroviensis CBS 10435 TaxID=1331196 RepID=A0A1B9IVR7_9TREE|nr:cofactor D [Kwoniella mangroviensis CBS 10435]
MSKDLASAPLEDDSDSTYTHFAHRAEFMELLGRFLEIDITTQSDSREDEDEEGLVNSMGATLDHYLPLPGLLDPSLDEIVPPLMDLLGANLHILVSKEEDDIKKTVNPKRLARLGRLLNWIVKVRGWKAVVPHLPSSIPNLPMLVTLLSPPTSASTSTTPSTPHYPIISSSESWELRAILLLWLALLLTVPFNLTALSSFSSPVPSSTMYGIDLPSSLILFSTNISPLAQQVILLSIPLLSRPGLEGAYSALVLARLYSREDTVQALPGFLEWASKEIQAGERELEAHFISSLLEFMALLPSLLEPDYLPALEGFLEDHLLPHLQGSRTAAGSGLIRKLAVKAKGRLWLAKIRKNGENDSDPDLPDGLEEWLDDLMGGLSDKDTIVRYSSAKYLARLASLLPLTFSSQIVEAVIDLFSGTEEEPAILTSFGTVIDPGGSSGTGGTMGFGGVETTRGEARWHGVCLALAEMARRGLIKEEDQIGNAVKWVVKALTFDLRRASHSIGANVRDAASYLLWSLSRACPPDMVKAHAEDMATSLICVALFDREVGVRRAASAAFQEGVGRLGLYPEGIDVLGKTDFYSVSVRRMAFTIAAPAVAIHKVYRDKMREHLHHITLRHWDTNMRIQGAQALHSILKLGNEVDVQDSLDREIKQLPSLDSVNVHGALLALTQIAETFHESDQRRQTIFDALSKIRPASFVSSQAADIFSSVCSLLVVILNQSIITSPSTQSVLDKHLELSMKRRESEVHESVARVYGKLSELRSSEKDVSKLISDLKSSRIASRQAASLALGHIKYPPTPSPLTDKAIKALLELLDKPEKIDIESRRAAVRSLGDIAIQRVDGVSSGTVTPTQLTSILQSFLQGLGDYTTDQRGDVGSWVRVQSLISIGNVLSTLDSQLNLVSEKAFDDLIGGIIKQGVEKLESVRGEAARTLAKLREAGWEWEGMGGMKVDLRQLDNDGFRYVNQKEWFASSMSILVAKYRKQLIAGLVLTVGSQVITLANAAFQPLLSYLTQHPNSIASVLGDLLELLEKNFTSNRIFIPTLQTLWKLFENGVLDVLYENGNDTEELLCNDILSIACKGIPNIKSIERITTCMRVVTSCLSSTLPANLKRGSAEWLSLFLGHKFPRIRAITSEELYLKLSSTYDELPDELEEILTGIEWTSEQYKEKLEEVIELIKSMMV